MMSVSPTITGRKSLPPRVLKETLSSDEEIFFDSNNVDIDDLKSNPETDDEFFDPQDGILKVRRKGSDADSTRPNSPTYGEAPYNGKPYTNLKNLAGLSSQMNPKSTHDDNGSQKGSVISSLSSFSHENLDAHQPQSGPTRKDVDTSGPSEPEDNRKSKRFSAQGNTPTVPDPMQKQHLEDAQVFQQIFAAGSGLGPTVRVHGTNKAGKSHFKDHVRLVQTLDVMHDGPIWTMKFSPSGQHLATGGQDAKVIIWCIAEIPKPESNSRGGSSGHSNAGSGANGEMASPHPHSAPGSVNGVVAGSAATGTSSANHDPAPTFATQNQEIDGTHNHHVIGPFLLNEPYRILEGHKADITDLSWSRSSFLLSASMDKYVRLWHVSRQECLQEFKHPDAVTAVEFNPLHDRYFLSGCFDRRIRVWDIIPDGQVREWAQAPDTVTSVTISPDGETVVAGLIQGQVFFYEYEGMRYKTQMDCRNRSGKYKNGCKVTGLYYVSRKEDPGHQDGNNNSNLGGGNVTNSNGTSASGGGKGGKGGSTVSHLITASFPPRRKGTASMAAHGQLLVSTNDHRIRLCRLEDYSVISKYKGHKNKAMQIKATMSDDGKFIISGSDSGDVFLWRTYEPGTNDKGQNKNSSSARGDASSAHGNTLLFTFDKVHKSAEYECFDGCDTGNNSSAGGNNNTGNHNNHAGPHHSSGGSGEFGSVSLICALFAPVEATQKYLRSQAGLLLHLKDGATSAVDDVQTTTHPPSGLSGRKLSAPSLLPLQSQQQKLADRATEQLLGRRGRTGSAAGMNQFSEFAPEVDPRSIMTELSSRVMVTADTDGMMRVYFRMV